MNKRQIVIILEFIILAEFIGRGISLATWTFKEIMELIFL